MTQWQATTGNASVGVARDLRALVLFVLTYMGCTHPDFALRRGAVIAVVLLILSLKDFRPSAVDMAAIAFAALVAASDLWSIDPGATRLSAKNTLAGVAIFLCVRVTGRNLRSWKAAGFGILGGCLYTVYQLYTDNDLHGVRLSLDDQGDRYTLEGLNPNFIAYALLTGMAVLLALLSLARLPKRWVIPSAIILLAFYAGITEAGTRGALVGMIAAAAWVLWCLLVRPRHGARRLRWLMVATAVVAATIVSSSFEQLTQKYFSASLRERGDLNGRFVLWPAARHWWWDHLWFGTGAGTFRTVSPAHVAAHNAILDIGAGVGLVGVALFVWLLYAALARESSPSRRSVLVIGAFVAATAPLLLSGYWIESPVFWAALGLVSTFRPHAGSDDDLVGADGGRGLVSGGHSREERELGAARLVDGHVVVDHAVARRPGQ